MGLHDIMCETFENCKGLQNLKNLSFNKRKKMHTHAHTHTHTHTHTNQVSKER